MDSNNVEAGKSSSFLKKKFSKLEKCLFLLNLLIAISCIIIVAIVFLEKDAKSNRSCLSSSCIKAAASILNQIDENINPCHNFYRFACGGEFNDDTPIPEDETNLWTVNIGQEKINARLNELISEAQGIGDSDDYRSKLSTFLRLCNNRDQLNSLGSKPLKDLLRKLGGWPLLTANWQENSFNLMDTLLQLRQFGYHHDIFAKITIGPHLFAHKYNIIYIGEAILGLDDRSYYEKNGNKSILNGYLEMMTNSAVLLGADRNEAIKELRKVLNFEIELAMLTRPKGVEHNFYNPMNLTEVQQLVPNFNWTAYFNGILDPFAYVSDETYIIVYAPEYLIKLQQLLVKTDSRTLANFLLWRVVMASTSFLSDEWSIMARQFYKLIDGRSYLRPRSKFCLTFARKHFSIAASALYVKSNPAEKNIPMVNKLVNYIKHSFVEMSKKADWMDSVTIEAALNKTNQMKLYVGHPEELKNDTKINEYYSELSLFDNLTSFEAVLLVQKWSTDLAYQKITLENQKGKWTEYSNVVEVNAYYRHGENTIQFPSSIIETTQVDADQPMYLNFGKIGWIIGHEITHGFDNFGRHINADGDYSHWWTENTKNQYVQRSQCFVEQYSNYTLNKTDESVDGRRTLSENIADNSGLREAFLGYRKYVEDYGEEAPLPGLSYTPNQLFFIATSKFYCGKWRLPSLLYMLRTDDHSPAMFRVVGTMSNMPEFAEAFSCPPESPMNPSKKCRLW